jgi:hypothetical protein
MAAGFMEVVQCLLAVSCVLYVCNMALFASGARGKCCYTFWLWLRFTNLSRHVDLFIGIHGEEWRFWYGLFWRQCTVFHTPDWCVFIVCLWFVISFTLGSICFSCIRDFHMLNTKDTCRADCCRGKTAGLFVTSVSCRSFWSVAGFVFYTASFM